MIYDDKTVWLHHLGEKGYGERKTMEMTFPNVLTAQSRLRKILVKVICRCLEQHRSTIVSLTLLANLT